MVAPDHLGRRDSQRDDRPGSCRCLCLPITMRVPRRRRPLPRNRRSGQFNGDRAEGDI